MVLIAAWAWPVPGFSYGPDPYLIGDVADKEPGGEIPLTPALENLRLYEWFGIRLGSDMDTLLAAYGGQAMRRATGWRSVCYAVRAPQAERYVIVHESLGSLAEIVVADRRDRIIPDLPCTPITSACPNPENPAGLRLGMSREEIIQLLGPPWAEQQGRITYASVAERPLGPQALQTQQPDAPDSATASSLSTVIFRLENGRAVIISVSRVETY